MFAEVIKCAALCCGYWILCYTPELDMRPYREEAKVTALR